MNPHPATLAVVEDPEAWPSPPAPLALSSLSDYLLKEPKAARVVNLCAATEPLSAGYYVSLLADGRGQAVEPTVDTLLSLGDPYALLRWVAELGVPVLELSEQEARGGGPIPRVQRRAGAPFTPALPEELVELRILGGAATNRRFQTLARRVYRAWPHPMLQLGLVRDQRRWRVHRMEALPAEALTPEERAQLLRHVARADAVAAQDTEQGFSLAVLFDPQDPQRPSDIDTLSRLERVATRLGVTVHRIGTDELGRLGEYDALFIRSLAGLEEPAARFAQRAESFGMPLIDDTASMLRCGNKVHLHALAQRVGLPTPETRLVNANSDFEALAAQLGLPFVLKLPDSSFSRGVKKVRSAEDFDALVGPWLARSPLLVAQAWAPTDFDWRVGVLDGRPLFACRYYMAKGHWQIAQGEGAAARYGRVEAVPRALAPPAVIALACEAASLMGEGLYGVDIKELDDGPVLIEINDNANLDTGYEDAADGDRVYEDLLTWFARRLEVPLRQRPQRVEPLSAALRAPVHAPVAPEPYGLWDVVGLELEYPVVDAALEPVGLVADTLKALHGHPCSEVELGAVAISNEIVDHVLELKTPRPLTSLVESERALAEGVRRVALALDQRHGARLMPTGMHPWFDPRKARLWVRSGRRIYATYARLFDVHTHGWANVQACHVNLPMGTEAEAVAMMNAARLLVPYLPALAASSPAFDGALQPSVDSRLAFILTHQERVPESLGELVPERIEVWGDYRRRVLEPMFAALDRLPEAGLLRREYFNARAAVFKPSRASMEVRVLDVQECVKADAAIAAFCRAALRWLVSQGAPPVAQDLLVRDLRATVEAGSAARVEAPHLLPQPGAARAALERLVDAAAPLLRPEEREAYLPLLIEITEKGSLAERIRQRLARVPPARLKPAMRTLWAELGDCLVENQPWEGRS